MDELQGRQKVEILFAVLMVVAAFTPALKVPLIGGVSLFDLGWPGYCVVALGIAAMVGAFLDSRWIPPICAGLTILLTACLVGYFTWRMSRMGMEFDRELKGNPFKGLAKAFAGAISLSWGCAVLVVSGVGCGIAQTLAELFLGSRRDEQAFRPTVRREPHFGPAPHAGRRSREPFLVREPRRDGRPGPR